MWDTLARLSFSGSILAFGWAALCLISPKRAGFTSRWESVPIWGFSAILLGIGTYNPSQSGYPPEWVGHEYEVLEAEGYSTGGRDRLQARIFAPTAITPEDRIATAMDAALHLSTAKRQSPYSSTLKRPDFVSVVIEATPFPSLYGNVLATVDYAPDGCGVSGSGDHCTGSVWTNLKASDMQLTKEQVEIWKSWERHKGDFTEQIEFGDASYEQVDEEPLIEFLAGRFGTTPDHISDQMMSKVRLVSSLKELELPN